MRTEDCPDNGEDARAVHRQFLGRGMQDDVEPDVAIAFRLDHDVVGRCSNESMFRVMASGVK